MKALHILILSLCGMIAFSQSCISQRYQDSIFHSVTVTSGIKYATATPYGTLAQPQDLYLDIYEPTGDTLSKRPVIVFQFGGAFLIGFRTQPPIPSFCEYFAKCGYVVVSIDYRIGFNTLSGGSAERAVVRSVQDQRAAIRHLAQRCNQYRIDTSSIFLTGTSAGCFAGLHSAFMVESQVPASSHGIPLEPDDLGCINCSGNNDYGNRFVSPRGIINQWGAILDTSFIDPWDSIPVLSIHGTADNAVPYENGYPFSYPVFPVVYGSHPITARMQHLGLKTQLVPLTGFGHEPELLNTFLNDTINYYTRLFLFDIIKPHTGPISGPSDICTGVVATYSVQPTNGSKYCWTLSGNGTIVQNNGHSIKVVWNSAGTMTIKVMEQNYLAAQGNEQSFTTEVVNHAISNFTATTNELDITLQNTSTNAVTYYWWFGDGSSFNGYAPGLHSYTAGGSYTILLVASNSVCSDSFSTTLTIDSCPVASINLQLNNRNAFFNTPTTNTVSYYWNFGDGDSAYVTAPNVFHQYAQEGTYTVVVRVVNQLGCSATDSITFYAGVNGIEENQEQVTVKRLGNTFNIQCSDITGDFYIELINIQGQQLLSDRFTGLAKIDLTNQANGVYFIKIGNATNNRIVKVVK